MSEQRVYDELLADSIACICLDIFRPSPNLISDAFHDLRDERAENEKLLNVINALKVAIRVTHSISEEGLKDMIDIARGD